MAADGRRRQLGGAHARDAHARERTLGGVAAPLLANQRCSSQPWSTCTMELRAIHTGRWPW
jgi:hypothetical protein